MRSPSEIVVLVPAYNEVDQIAATIESLLRQTLPVKIIVIANNCTDATAEIANRYPVTVLDMPENNHRKAGALNHAWPLASAGQLVLTMDADTTLMPNTIEKMVNALEADASLGAVCARYWAKDANGLIWRLQRLEYARYDDNRQLRGWKVQVASGAASLYRVEALDRACSFFGRENPWDNQSLIEDYALTLDLKTIGYRVRAAPGAHVLTDTPLTVNSLWQQRLRWGRGGFDECRKRGWTPATRRDICSYWLFAGSILIRLLFVAYMVSLLALGAALVLNWIWMVFPALMLLDRVSSAWRVRERTRQDVALMSCLVVEDVYGLALEVCTFMSIYKSLRAVRQAW